jgi:hypothetical protein
MRGARSRYAHWRIAATVLAIVAATIVVLLAFLDPKATAAGWLIGLAFWSQILIGSLTLIMIHRLTGGRWGLLLAPSIEPAAASLPLLIVLAIPIFLALPTLYPWHHQPATIKTDVSSYYLNIPTFILRSLVALIGWSSFVIFLLRPRGRSAQLFAALGLVFNALAISSISIDWYLSLEAPFNSSSFGATIAIASLAAALAWAALTVPSLPADPALSDLGCLLLATLLGLTYMNFMAVLVIWYGDLPAESVWFVERAQFPWQQFAWAAFALASLLPIFALMIAKMRSDRGPLRAIGGGVLIGMAAFDIYLIGPPVGTAAILPAVLSILTIGLLLIGLDIGRIAGLAASQEMADAR